MRTKSGEFTYREGKLSARDGTTLFEQAWMPVADLKAVVLLVHGLGEHSSRYAHLAGRLVRDGYGMETFDLRGHGKSAGRRAYIEAFEHYLEDLDIYLARLRERHPGKKIFLYGHSMGATIGALFAITRRPEISGLILSGISLKLGDDIPRALVKMSRIIGKYAPHMRTVKLEAASMSRDPQVVKNYDEDPLNYRLGIPARTGLELLKAMEQIREGADQIEMPVLIMQGQCDQVVNPEGSRELYVSVTSQDKTLKNYSGFYHEIHNDPEKEKVFSDLIAWLTAHI